MKFNLNPEVGSSGSTTFLKLKDKDVVQGIFRGDVHEFYSKWENGKSTVCSPEEGRFRFRINFITKENGTLTAKIWEGGAVVYNQLKDLNDLYPLETTMVTIKRNGADMGTTYTILPQKETVGPVLENTLKSVTLHDLTPKEKGNFDNDPTTW